jgi:nicotinamidase-related amidase
MHKRNPILQSLVRADDSALVIIDVQEHFIGKLNKKAGRLLISRIGWLAGLAGILGVPLIVTAEDIPRLGGIYPVLNKKLPPGLKLYNKMSFGLAGQPDIVRAVSRSGRKTMVLAGLETDVCVAQSALGLMELGYQVAVIPEAVGSPGPSHKKGLERIKQAGGLILPLKGLYYEWVRAVRKDKEVMRRLGAPDGVRL